MMKNRCSTTVLVALLVALVGGAALVTGGGGGMPFPDVTIPGLPDTGPCCLVRVQKTSVDTIRRFDFGDPYLCKVGDKAHKTVRGPATVKMPLVPGGLPCDEDPKLIPQESLLEAKGVLTRRLDDGFSHFLGTFTIRKDNMTLFKGTMETIDNISTHHEPFGNDPCDMKGHLQGWLVGAGVDRSVAKYTLRALIEAKIRGDTNQARQDALIPLTLDGVLIECHQDDKKKETKD